MSLYDRQQGTFDGVAIGAGATARRYGAAINEWEAHANHLQGKLQHATSEAEDLAKQRLFAQAQIAGLNALLQAFKDELARVSPASPLLKDDGTRKNISGTAMAKVLQAHGYHYDKKTERVTKITP